VCSSDLGGEGQRSWGESPSPLPRSPPSARKARGGSRLTMSTIRILAPTVANQIAAGEVVERPAAVIKELVENSLDAGARRVTVDFSRGGKAQMSVEDDGKGMTGDEALLSLERHATSKIQLAADPDRIATFGFRGEALPSIASVARFTLPPPPAAASAPPVRPGDAATRSAQVPRALCRSCGRSRASWRRGATPAPLYARLSRPARSPARPGCGPCRSSPN